MSIPWINLGGSRGVGKTTLANTLAGFFAEDEVVWLDRVSTRPVRSDEKRTREYQFPEYEKLRLMLTSVGKVRTDLSTDFNDFGPDQLVGFNDYNPAKIKAFTLEGGKRFRSRPVKIGGKIYSKAAMGESSPDIVPGSIEILYIDRKTYLSAVPGMKYFPQPGPKTKLVISIFGRCSPKMKPRVMEYAPEYVPEMTNIFVKLKVRDLKKRLRKRNDQMGLSFDEVWPDTLQYLRTHPEKEFDHVIYNDGTPEECVIEIAKIVGLSLPAKVLR